MSAIIELSLGLAVKGQGPTVLAGEVPRYLFLLYYSFLLEFYMQVLSIHVDESGDFGDYNTKFAPYYIFTLVFHNQVLDISEDIKRLD